MNQYFINQIGDFFLENNFRRYEPLNVCSQEDDSMIFIGTSTSAFKEFLIGKKDLNREKLFVLQPCIKTHNLKNYEENTNQSLEQLSFFYMIGTIEEKTIDLTTLILVRDFLFIKLKFSPQNIVIITPNEQILKLIKVVFNGYSIRSKVNAELTNYSFGTNLLSGKAILFYFRYNNVYYQIGDIVLIRNKKKEIDYLEVCFGVNNIDMIYNSKKKLTSGLFSFNSIQNFLELPDSYDFDVFYDSLIVSLEIIKNDKSINLNSKRNERVYILRKYIKFIMHYYKKLNIQTNLQDIISEYYSTYHYTCRSELNSLISRFYEIYNRQMQIYEKNIAEYMKYLKTNIHFEAENVFSIGKVKYGLLNEQINECLMKHNLIMKSKEK